LVAASSGQLSTILQDPNPESQSKVKKSTIDSMPVSKPSSYYNPYINGTDNSLLKDENIISNGNGIHLQEKATGLA
jgi:hypothetical protein